jgi:nicotinate-nucleotide adenylyltransferase
MRLGILGGTFDPVHYGHLLLAEACREALGLDQVWFVPAAVPPHKQQREQTPGPQRVEMLELAISGHAAFSVCQVEIARGGVNYTVDTLARLKDEDPLRELFFLLGTDSLLDLPTWREPARLCQLATPVVVCRSIAGDNSGECGEALDLRGLANLLPADRLEAIRMHRVQMPRIDLTSSDIRQRISMGKSIRYRTPRAVEKYIETHALYRNLDPESGRPGRCRSGC